MTGRTGKGGSLLVWRTTDRNIIPAPPQSMSDGRLRLLEGNNCQGPMIAPNGWLVHFSALSVAVVVSTTTIGGEPGNCCCFGWRAA